MERIFFDRLGRLRSGWRFAFFLSLFFFLAIPLMGLVGTLLGFLGIDPRSDAPGVRIAYSAVPLAVAICVAWFTGRILEQLPIRALGVAFTKYWFRDYLYGLGLGSLAIGFAVLPAVAAGGLAFEPNSGSAWNAIIENASLAFLVFFVGAAFEEVLARGYMFQTFVRSNLAWLAVIVTSLFFASGHLGNPEAGYTSFVNTSLAGVWLGVAYLKTRTLWLPFGLHLSWNWVQGSLLGIEVSGLTDLANTPVFKEIDLGPEWLTGGEYGLEGGFACTFALIAATLLVWFAPFLRPDAEMLRLTSGPEIDSGSERATT